MNFDSFIKSIRDPRRTEADLRGIIENCINKQKIGEAKAVDRELRTRFPTSRRDRREKAVIVGYSRLERIFSKSKDGYVWMVEKFCAHHPEIFNGWKRDFVCDSLKIKFISDKVSELFPDSPALMNSKANYARLSNGLYLRMHLGNKQKLWVLCKLSAACNMDIWADWSWQELI